MVRGQWRVPRRGGSLSAPAGETPFEPGGASAPPADRPWRSPGKRSPGPFSHPAHSWNHTSSGLPCAVSGRAARTRSVKFFIYGLGLGVALRVPRARRQAGKSEPVEDRAHAPLRQPYAKALFDHGAKVDTAPAHHPVRRRIRPGFHDRGQFAQLFVVQPRPAPRKRPIDEARRALGIVAVDPFVGATVPRTVA